MNIEQVKDRVAAYVRVMDDEVRQINCSPTRPHRIVMASLLAAQGVHDAAARVEKTSNCSSALEYVRLLREATLDRYRFFQEYAAVDKPSYWDEDGYGSCRFTGLLYELDEMEAQSAREESDTIE